MIRDLVKGRVMVFIDAANILYSQQTLEWRVDYKKLFNYFKSECALQAIYFYTGRVGENHKQNAFLQKLAGFGYHVTSKEVKRIKISKDTCIYKGNLDVELTIDVIGNLTNFDTLILMSGDSDFAPLLDLAKLHRKQVLIISTKGHVAKELLNRAKYINMKKLKEHIEYLM